MVKGSQLNIDINQIDLQTVNMSIVQEAIDRLNLQWVEISVNNAEKLRTYRMFNIDNKTKDYVYMFLSRRQRSLLSQLRLGVLPLRIETGRYTQGKKEDRICNVCNKGEIEDALRFMTSCDKYNTLRREMYNKKNDWVFHTLDDTEKMIDLMQHDQKLVAVYTEKAITLRNKILFL
jgi:hypothetical protein